MKEWTLVTLPPRRRDEVPESRRQSRPAQSTGRSTGRSGTGHLFGEGPLMLMLIVLLLAYLVHPAAAGPSTGDDVNRALDAGVGLSAQQTITVIFQQGASPTAGYSGVADTYISSSAETTNYGGAVELRLAYDSRDRILLRFDLAGYIPQQAVVTEAWLELFAYYSEYPSASTDVGIYEVLRPWTERGATWNRAAADADWQQAGCAGPADRSSAYTSVAQFSTASEWQVWHNTPLADLVQYWVSDPAQNYGVILLGLPGQARQFWTLYSSQVGGVSEQYGPRLTVSYYVPVSTPTPTLTPTATPTTIPTSTNVPTPSATPSPTRTLTPTQTVTTAVVSGLAWRDDNTNQQRDPGESPMSGVTVIMRNPAHVELGRRATIGDGSYEFANLAQGSYLLTKEDPAGYGSTWPPGGAYAFNLATGQRLTGMDFGFAPLSTGTPTITPTPTSTPTEAATATHTATPVTTATATPTVTLLTTSTDVGTATITPTPPTTATPTQTPTTSPTPTPSLEPTLTLTLTPTPIGTPAGSLQDPIPIGCGEIYNGSTVGFPSVINDYGGCGAGMWGSEIVYSFHAYYELDWLGVSLDTPADLALFLLSSANPATCFSSGGSVVVSSVAEGTDYYVVVDGSESAGYTLEVYCHPSAGTTPTSTPTRTATATAGPSLTPTIGPSPTPTKTRTPGGPSEIYLPIVCKPGMQILVDCGADTDYPAATGQLWLADRAYTSGGWGYVGYADTWSTNQDVVVDTPSLVRLYQTVRYGDSFGYQFDVPNGEYKVELLFAEIYHTAAGRRVFDVILEGQTKLDDYDIFVAAGGKLRADVKSFTIAVSDGQLDLILDAKVDLASINAIRVIEQ